MNAPPTPSPAPDANVGGLWHGPASEAPLHGPVVAELDELGHVDALGPDAIAFLHAQLTADLQGLAPGTVQPAGLCTPKGRLLAIFQAWRIGEGVRLQLPRALVAATLRRLGMFVLRSKVRLVDASAALCSFGLTGQAIAARLAELGLPVPPAPNRSVSIGDATLLRLPASPRAGDRLVLVAPAGERAAWRERLATLAPVPPAGWWWAQIDAGIPELWPATQEGHVPQMINFEVLGGVSFRKGCYPGQEVVARSQYRGKLARRMSPGHAEAGALPGTDVYATSADGEPRAVGSVVMAAAAPGGGYDLLFECSTAELEGRLTLGADGAAIAVRPLPYELVDVTA